MKKTMSISLEEDLIEKLKEKADEDNRPVSNYVETIIKEKLEEE